MNCNFYPEAEFGAGDEEFSFNNIKFFDIRHAARLPANLDIRVVTFQMLLKF